MRILRSPVETPDFENLLRPTGSAEAGRGQPAWLPDPFDDTTPEAARPIEPRADRVEPFPARPLGPYRPHWRESTFLRAVGLEHTRCVGVLCQWGRRGVFSLGRSDLLVPADLVRYPGRHVVEVNLRRSAPWSLAVPMELELIPWSQTFATTWLALCPRRRVRLSRRYFRAGHAFLDRLVTELLTYAGPPRD